MNLQRNCLKGFWRRKKTFKKPRDKLSSNLNKRMRPRNRYRLKDILINHVFDYCYNEVVKKFESEGFKFSSDGTEGFKNPSIQTLIEHSIKNGSIKFYHGKRDSEYCKILVITF